MWPICPVTKRTRLQFSKQMTEQEIRDHILFERCAQTQMKTKRKETLKSLYLIGAAILGVVSGVDKTCAIDPLQVMIVLQTVGIPSREYLDEEESDDEAANVTPSKRRCPNNRHQTKEAVEATLVNEQVNNESNGNYEEIENLTSGTLTFQSRIMSLARRSKDGSRNQSESESDSANRSLPRMSESPLEQTTHVGDVQQRRRRSRTKRHKQEQPGTSCKRRNVV